MRRFEKISAFRQQPLMRQEACSVSAERPQYHHQQQQQQEPPLRSSCLPVQSGAQLPQRRIRTASGSSADSEVRQSLELEATMAARAVAAGSNSKIPIALHAEDSFEACESDTKSSSGPINTGSGGARSPVKRTRSLKEQLINKCSYLQRRGGEQTAGQCRPLVTRDAEEVPAAADSPLDSPRPADGEEFLFEPNKGRNQQQQQRSASSPKRQQNDSSLEDLAGQSRRSNTSTPTKQLTQAKPPHSQQQQQQQQPQHLHRSNRGGSMRGKTGVKVLPDRQPIGKASSSENISQQLDLSTLTSLVQKKRDRSQESLDQGGKSSPLPTPIPGSATRKPPTPTSLDSDDGSDTAKSKPPTGKRESTHSRRQDSPTIAAAASGAAAALGCTEAADTDRDSLYEEQQQQSDGEAPAPAVPTGQHRRSGSLEAIIQDAQSRTAPQIRQPSARSGRRDPSPCKSSAPGSSPPKVVSFNLNHEVNTFEASSSEHRRRRHSHSGRKSRDQQQPQQSGPERNGDQGASKIGDNALVEVHCSLVEAMANTIAKQRAFLSQVKDGQIKINDYREIMKTLLQMQTKTIQSMVDTIQSNETN